MEKSKSCWTCLYHKNKDEKLLGACGWFETSGKGQNKDIPPDVVDKGCRYWNDKAVPIK